MKKPAKSDKPKILSSEAVELWRQVTKNVEPLPGKNPDGDDFAVEIKTAEVAAKPRSRVSPVASHPVPAASAKSDNGFPPSGFDRQTARKIKRGRMAVESRIDLHGMTQEQAYKALDIFIATAATAGKRLVLVITGKGSGPGTTGVLRRNVPHWLRQISSSSMVIGHSEAEPRDGGAGALYVRLRKKPKG